MEYDFEKEYKDDTFYYQMLDRLRTDCEYYLGYGNRNVKCLWAGNEKEQIEFMKRIWSSFLQDKKPEWLSLEKIEEYERKMVNSYNYKSEIEEKNIVKDEVDI